MTRDNECIQYHSHNDSIDIYGNSLRFFELNQTPDLNEEKKNNTPELILYRNGEL